MGGKAEGAWICGVGMMTAVGDSAAQTASSVRAGINRYQLSSVYNRRFQPMTLALLPEDALAPLSEELQAVPGLTSRQIRMLRLAKPALEEAVQALAPGEKAPLFLATPEPMAGRPPAVTEPFLDRLLTQSGGRFDRPSSKVFSAGRAAGLQALGQALKMLAEGKHSHVLVGGIDTYFDLYLLGTLDMEGRVLADGAMDGFAPGEGAGFLLLSTARHRHGPVPGVRVFPPGLADEAGHRYSDQPYRGDGLADAVRLGLEPLAGVPVETVLCSLNGENFGAKEWGVAYLRSKAGFADGHRFEHPADCFGDAGAAVGPLLLGLAAIGMAKGYLSGPCLVWCSSDREPRAAACVIMEDARES